MTCKCLESREAVALRSPAPNVWSLKQGPSQYLLYKVMSQIALFGEMLLVNSDIIVLLPAFFPICLYSMKNSVKKADF